MAKWHNGKLTKWQVDKMVSWQNGKLTKWQVNKMASWQKKQVDEMATTTDSRPSDEQICWLLKQQVDEMQQVNETSNWQNGILTEWQVDKKQVDEMAIWQNDLSS